MLITFHFLKSWCFLSVPLRIHTLLLLKDLLSRDHRTRWMTRTSKSVVFFQWDPGACWGGIRRVCGRVWWGDRFAWSICHRADTWNASPRCACESVASARQSVRISSYSLARYNERVSHLRTQPQERYLRGSFKNSVILSMFLFFCVKIVIRIPFKVFINTMRLCVRNTICFLY